MHEHYRTKGIVLAKKDSGEADQIFVLYTCDFGKIEVVGKAIRKITSKLRAGLDIFYLVEIEFIQGKSRKTLTDAIVIDKFLGLRKNLEVLACFGQIAEVVCALINKEQKEENVWDLLTLTFQKLNQPEETRPPKNSGSSFGRRSGLENSLEIENCKLKIILNYFLWNFLVLLGYAPNLYNCSICSNKLLPEALFLSPAHGGVICQGCCNFSALEISVETVKLIRFFLKEPIDRAEKLNINQEGLRNLDKTFRLYFNFLLEKI